MTKADIVESIYNRIGGISKKESADLVERLIAYMKDTFSSGENLKITGFGHFIVKDKKARKGINPQTKDQIILPKHPTTNEAAVPNTYPYHTGCIFPTDV